MFGVSRCAECNSILTEDDLKCVGCGRIINPAVGPPLPCDECGKPKGTNSECERCVPRLKPLDPADVIPERTLPPIRDEDLPFWRTRPLYLGALAAAVALLVGYFWGRADQQARDEGIFDQTRRQVLSQIERERQVAEKERAEVLEKAAESHNSAGPAGLRWGDAPDVVKANLTKKLKFVSEGSGKDPNVLLQHYVGSFANLPAQEIQPEFCQGRLSTFVVVLSRESPSLYRRWLEALDTIRFTYGEPTGIEEPTGVSDYQSALVRELNDAPDASVGGAGLSSSALLAVIDDSVLSGKSRLFARWDLSRQASIILASEVSSGGGDGSLRGAVVWTFGHSDFAEPCSLMPLDTRDQ